MASNVNWKEKERHFSFFLFHRNMFIKEFVRIEQVVYGGLN